MDWDTLETELTTALVEQVRGMIADFPGLDFHAAALGPLYHETDGIISLPDLNFNTDGELSELPGDWEIPAVDWLPDGRGGEIERALQEEACRSTVEHWHETFKRYLAVLIRACGNAREQLDGVLVFIYDDDDPNYEFLLRSCLTEDELAQHFPKSARRKPNAPGSPPCRRSSRPLSMSRFLTTISIRSALTKLRRHCETWDRRPSLP